VIDFLRWLLTIEVISLAFLPVATWLLRSLPDGGYVFARVLGLLLVTYLTWIVGSFVPVGNSIVPAVLIVGVAAAAGWAGRWEATLSVIRRARFSVTVEEALFVAALAVWSVLRVQTFGASAIHTEQLMDVAFLNASFHAASYPPYDPWMSGGTINYYYFGYLAVAMLCKLSHTATEIGFTLANSTLFALTIACAYSIGYAVTRRVAWSLLAPAFVALVGNWHAALWQSAHGVACGSTDTFWGSFWESTRVIGSGFNVANWASGPSWAHAVPCSNPNATITEYPLFSFILGDMHPHVMALPFTLLVIAIGLSVVLAPDGLQLDLTRASVGRFLLLAVSVGSLFAINSWDFLGYFLLLAACIGAGAYLGDDSPAWWRRPALAIVALGVLAVALYAPFYLHLHSPTHGIGLVTTPTDLFEFVQVFGLFVLGTAGFVVALGLLLQPAADEGFAQEPALAAETGQVKLEPVLWIAALAALVILLGVRHQTVLVLLGAIGIGASLVLHRVMNTEAPNRADAASLLLTIAGCIVLMVPELVYLKDSFDASVMYRMNTVFKFYYEGWVLLGLASAYGAWRAWGVFSSLFGPVAGWMALAVMALGTLAAAVYTGWAPSAVVAAGAPRTLDSLAWLKQSEPGEYAAIGWLRSHVSGHPVVLEATQPQGGDYSYSPTLYAGVSAFTGLPTVMGWKGHEEQWGRDTPLVDRRASDVATIYSTHSVTQAERLLRQYHVGYVVVGETERQTFGSAEGLGKFSRFMKVAATLPGATIYRW
jgi:YYY domain-containing protein